MEPPNSEKADSDIVQKNQSHPLEDPNPENELNAKKHKNNRSLRACLICRQRKVKCDAVERYPERCKNCVEFNIKHCIIPEPKKRRSKKIEQLLQTDSYVELVESSPNVDNSKDVSMKNLEKDIHRGSSKSTDYISIDNHLKYPEMSVIEIDPVHVFERKKTSVSHYVESIDWVGPLCEQALSDLLESRSEQSQASIGLDNLDFAYLKSIGCFSLPSEEICWKWIDCFFTSRYYQSPILFEQKFRDDYKDLRKPPSLLLLHSILYAGARFYYSNTWTDKEKKDQIKKADIFYKRAKSLLNCKVEGDAIFEIQALALLGNNTSKNTLSCETDSSNVRLAIDSLYTLRMNDDFVTSEHLTDNEKRLYKRIYWTIVRFDTLYAYILGKPWTIDSLILNDVPMIEESDLRNEIDDPSTDTLPQTLMFVHQTKLLLCIRKVCETNVKVKHNPELYCDLFRECDQMMKDWIEQLPNSLLFRINASSNNIFNASTSLEYYSVLLLLHRHYILNHPTLRKNEQAYPSWNIVFKAAHMVAVIIRYLMENNYIFFCQNIIPFAAMVSGTMMIYHLYNKDKVVHSIAKADIETFLQLLQTITYNHPYAHICYLHLKSIYEDKTKQIKLLHSMLRNNTETKGKDTQKANPNNAKTNFENQLLPKLNSPNHDTILSPLSSYRPKARDLVSPYLQNPIPTGTTKPEQNSSIILNFQPKLPAAQYPNKPVTHHNPHLNILKSPNQLQPQSPFPPLQYPSPHQSSVFNSLVNHSTLTLPAQQPFYKTIEKNDNHKNVMASQSQTSAHEPLLSVGSSRYGETSPTANTKHLHKLPNISNIMLPIDGMPKVEKNEKHPVTSYIRSGSTTSTSQTQTFSPSNSAVGTQVPILPTNGTQLSDPAIRSQNEQDILFKKFDYVMPPETVPALDNPNWRPVFDVSLLGLEGIGDIGDIDSTEFEQFLSDFLSNTTNDNFKS